MGTTPKKKRPSKYDVEPYRSARLIKAINERYGDVRKFAIELKVPYHILNRVLETDVNLATYGLVSRMCEKLGLDMYTMKPSTTVLTTDLIKSDLIRDFMKLNALGKARIMEMIKNYLLLDGYHLKEDEYRHRTPITDYYDNTEEEEGEDNDDSI